LHYTKVRKEDLEPIIDKILKKTTGWRGKLLNHVAKLGLVRSLLASRPLYLLRVIKFPKWAITLIPIGVGVTEKRIWGFGHSQSS
jgi:hypothetical protein